MPVITERTRPDVSGADLPPVRLSLKPPGPQTGLLDGAWWPRSRDLAAELPALLAVLAPEWGRMTRVAVDPSRWDAPRGRARVPSEVTVAGRAVKVGDSTEGQDPETLLLRAEGPVRRDLLVIPPTLGEAAAARLMAAATDPESVRTASELLAEETAEESWGERTPGSSAPGPRARDGSAPVEPTDTWEDEGGAVPGTGPP